MKVGSSFLEGLPLPGGGVRARGGALRRLGLRAVGRRACARLLVPCSIVSSAEQAVGSFALAVRVRTFVHATSDALTLPSLLVQLELRLSQAIISQIDPIDPSVWQKLVFMDRAPCARRVTCVGSSGSAERQRRTRSKRWSPKRFRPAPRMPAVAVKQEQQEYLLTARWRRPDSDASRPRCPPGAMSHVTTVTHILLEVLAVSARPKE